MYFPCDDYLSRQELIEKMKAVPEIALPSPAETPPYTYLERKLAAYRLEVETGLAPAGDNRAALDAGGFAHLLSRLLKRRFAAHERLLIHTAWRAYGPFGEELVRQTVGRLLGESHPESDLSGFLDALRIAAESLPAKS